DSTSNTGQYAGQIQFNLSTISSHAAFVNWEEAIIELPVKLQILNGGAATNNVGEFGLANTYSNRGAAERSLFTALDQQSSKLAFDVMGGSANLQAVSKPQVYVAPAGAVAAASPFYVAHYLACIKVRDISDYFKKCPMQKNTRDFIYLNYNSSSTTLVTTGTAGAVSSTTIASLSNNMNFGNTCPVLCNLSSGVTATALAGGLALPASA
ncbi:hypothetical protein L914_02934, partial [Phytophthora nicotianae]